MTAPVDTRPPADGGTDPAPRPPRRPDAPRPAGTGPLGVLGRVVSLAAVTGIGVAAVVVLPGRTPAPAPAPAARTLPVAASAAVPVCPGPEPLQTPEGGRAVAPAGPTVVAALAAPPGLVTASGALAPGAPAAARLGPLTAGPGAGAPDAGTKLTATRGVGAGSRTLAGPGTKSAGAVRLDADRRGGASPVVGATQATLVRTGDLRGLSAVSCGVASTSAWLVGGGTQEGRRARLLLANPAPSPAVVSVAVLGPRGRVATPSVDEVVVPAGAQRTLLIDAVAPGLTALAVHVTTRSGRVVASLHDEYVRGLSPAGTDAVTGAQEPSKRQVVPGIAVASGGTTVADAAAPGAYAVRVVVPGPNEAVVKVRLLGPTGPVDLRGAVATVPGGSVADIPVANVGGGLWTAVVEADVPVVATALVGRVAPPKKDTSGGVPTVLPSDVPVSELAWAPSAAPVAGTTLVAAPRLAGVASWLGIGALTAARVVVVPVGADGAPLAPRTVDVAAGSTATVILPDGAAGAVLRTLDGTVYPALVLLADDPAGGLVAVAPVRTGGILPADQARTVSEDARTGLR